MAPATARAALEALLRDRKLDNTLTTALPLTSSEYADRVVASGISDLDEALGGGLPRGQISEIVGAASSGRTSLLMACLADATARGELVALIDALDRFDPSSAAAAGVRLDRLLWIRGDGAPDEQPVIETAWHPARPQPGRRRMTPMDRAVGRALKALNLVLSAGGFGVVALDAGEVPAHALRALPFTTWLRLQRVIAASDTACVLLADAPLARRLAVRRCASSRARRCRRRRFMIASSRAGTRSSARLAMRLFQLHRVVARTSPRPCGWASRPRRDGFAVSPCRRRSRPACAARRARWISCSRRMQCAPDRLLGLSGLIVLIGLPNPINPTNLSNPDQLERWCDRDAPSRDVLPCAPTTPLCMLVFS